jgi:ABC-type antimicrobial peptide transport system ATPase subunit
MLLCLSKDAYDLLVEAEYYQTQKLSQLLQKKADKLYTWEVKTIENEQKSCHQMTLEINQQILENIASIQTELINASLEEWRKIELENVKNNPTTYIKTKISEA